MAQGHTRTQREALLIKKVGAIRKHYPAYAEAVLGIDTQPFQLEWIRAVAEQERVLIEAPREHGKTTHLGLGLPTYLLGKNPELRQKIISHSTQKASDQLRGCANIIENNRLFNIAFPKCKKSKSGPWSTTHLLVECQRSPVDVSIEAAGIFSSATGGRADIIWGDDPVDFVISVMQPRTRVQSIKTFDIVWRPFLVKGGKFVVIATSTHEKDLIRVLASRNRWKDGHIRQPVGDATDQFKPLWPTEWPRTRLIAEYEEDPESFSMNYWLKPISQFESQFPPELWDDMMFTERPMRLNELPAHWPRVLGIDLASGQTKYSSYTVLFALAMNPENGQKYPLDIKRGRFKPSETVDLTIEMHSLWNFNKIIVETNAFQAAFKEWVQQRAGSIALPIEGAFTTRTKHALGFGIPSIVAQFQQQQWTWPVSHNPNPNSESCLAGSTCIWCLWGKELIAYPYGEHSDTVMAMWLAEKGLRVNKNLFFWIPGETPSPKIVSKDTMDDQELTEEQQEIEDTERQKKLEKAVTKKYGNIF